MTWKKVMFPSSLGCVMQHHTLHYLCNLYGVPRETFTHVTVHLLLCYKLKSTMNSAQMDGLLAANVLRLHVPGCDHFRKTCYLHLMVKNDPGSSGDTAVPTY
jgi:hypothetical protein